MAANGSFDALLTKNVPHIVEKIFLSLDYKSFKTCRKVSMTWKQLLTSESFQMKEKSVFIMELRDFIERAMEQSLVQGDTWYLCDVHWFAQLQKYLGLSDGRWPYGRGDQTDIGDPSAHPGHIDLSGLFQDGDPSAELKEDMVSDMDYTLMPESAWDKLVEIFDLTKGQNPVARKVINSAMFINHCKIEVYFLELKLADYSTMNDVRSAKFSRNDTLGDIVDEMRRLFNVPEDVNTRLWNKYSGDTLEHLSHLEQTVQEAGLFENQLLVLASAADNAARWELGDFIKKAMEKSFIKGDTWYLCDMRWFVQLKKYLGLSYDPKGWANQANIGVSSAHPGHIDLSGLFQDGDSSTELREHMISDLDYTVMPESAWDKLVEVFDLTEGQNPVARKVIDSGMFIKHCKIEVYFIELRLAEYSTMNDVHSAKFSRNDTLGDIEDDMRQLFNVPEHASTLLWKNYSKDSLEHLSKPEQTVQEAGIFENQLLVLEKQTDGKWPDKRMSMWV